MEKDTSKSNATKNNRLEPSVLFALNEGHIQTRNLSEWLTVDHELLLENVLSSIAAKHYISPCLTSIGELKNKSTPNIILTIGKTLGIEANRNNDHHIFELLAQHMSDSVRCWAAYFIGTKETLTLDQKLEAVKRFASDDHFGVREIAWMALRPDVEKDLLGTIEILRQWTNSENYYLRRFTTELTRPRGVWCKHLNTLKENPQIALPLLEPLKSDPEKYVQDSVSNWLNDASKTKPDWVIEICNRWNETSPSLATKRITERALRTIKKS
jgi:3-methyladenine DNA glycosylase AlkC